MERVPLRLHVSGTLRGLVRAAARKARHVLRRLRQLHADGGVELGRLQALGRVLQLARQLLQPLLVRQSGCLLFQRGTAGGKRSLAFLQLRQTGAAAGGLRPLDAGAQG